MQHPPRSPSSPHTIIDAADVGRLRIATRGAHITSWQTANGQERLYMSALSATPEAPPVRGGVPICFPQFGTQGSLPKHGFVRDMQWHVDSVRPTGLTMKVTDNEWSRSVWPYRFALTLSVEMSASSLTCKLTVENHDSVAWSFTGGLHPYLRVPDSRRATLVAPGHPRISEISGSLAEGVMTDDIGPRVDGGATLRLPHGAIVIEQSKEFVDTVIWNPADHALKDLPASDRFHFICVEPAAITSPPVVAPGDAWQGTMVLTTSDDE